MTNLKELFHRIIAKLGALAFQNPSSKLFVIGVTGTKGKSTVLELINYILETEGIATAVSSSVRIKVGEEEKENLTGNTMPGRAFLQRFLRKAVNAGCKYALIETTSQGILQNRHKHIDFDVAVLTNVHPEHIEAHGSFENYRNAKIQFFKDIAIGSKKAKKYFVLNHDDPNTPFFVGALRQSGYREEDIIFFSAADIKDWELKMMGEFNRANVAAAHAVAKKVLNIDEGLIREIVGKFDGVPGRLEFVRKHPFTVVVDYAHTPHSLEAVYRTLKDLKPKKMICVLGSAGGGRDKWKRPVLGKIASELCEEVILTNEDPYDEKPETIVSEIAEGIPNGKYTAVIDRREAIRKALSEAKHGDLVVITGKGNEPFLHLENDKKVEWNEVQVVKDLSAELGYKEEVLKDQIDETKDY